MVGPIYAPADRADGGSGEGRKATLPPGYLLSYTYRIDRLLARGGMGEVYSATHVEMHTRHAIKVILPELAGDTKILDLFRREASTLRTVRNDAVVGYEGVFRDEAGRPYLVMELVEGPSLRDVMREEALGVGEVMELRDRLARGLLAAHEKGIVHRDMSPDNVILEGGELSKAKIIDFGIAKLTDPGTATILGDDFAGKYTYVSPEQLGMYGGRVDARSDVYSLGLVLAAAARGYPLDMGRSPAEVVEARRQLPDLSGIAPAVREDLEWMLQPEPSKRPQSMREVIGGVRILDDDTTAVGQPRPHAERYAAEAGTRSRPWGLIAALVFAAATIALGAWVFLGEPAGPRSGAGGQGDGGQSPSASSGQQATATIPAPTDDSLDETQAASHEAQMLADEAATAIDRSAPDYSCASIDAWAAGTGVRLAGFVSSAVDLAKLRREALAATGKLPLTIDVEVVEWPHCEVLQLARNEELFGSAAKSGFRLSIDRHSGRYEDGDPLFVDFSVPVGFKAYIYVAYIDSDGKVTQLVPGALGKSTGYASGSDVTLGTGGTIKMRQPYGRDTVMALASPIALPGLAKSPPAKADEYLDGLERSLEKIPGNLHKPLLVYRFLRVVPSS